LAYDPIIVTYGCDEEKGRRRRGREGLLENGGERKNGGGEEGRGNKGRESLKNEGVKQSRKFRICGEV